MRRAALVLLALACPAVAFAAGEPAPARLYEEKIQPLLERHCTRCHSAQEKKTKAGLALDTPAGWRKGGTHGPVLIPGDPENSLIVAAVRYKDAELEMPPDEKLADGDIRLLEQWVRLGAPGPAPAAVAGGTCEDTRPAPTVRRLTRTQYENTLQDLLGVTSDRVADLLPDERQGAFASNLAAPLPALALEKYLLVAEDVARKATERLPALLGCDPRRAGEAACVRQFITSFGARAYRRPLEASEVAELARVFARQRPRAGVAGAWRAVVESVLISPHFLYLPDANHPQVPSHRRAFARAAQLAYFLWQGPPDEALLRAAEAGELGTPEGVRRQAERLLDDPRGQRGLLAFFDQWSGLEELPSLERAHQISPPKFADTLRPVLHADARAFFLGLFDRPDGTVTSLFSGSPGASNPELSLFYREAIYINKPQNQKVEAGPPEPAGARRGLLTHPGLLAVYAHPTESSVVLRGKFIRERVLCQTLPPPPADANDVQPTGGKEDARTLAQQRLTEPRCASCHRMIDPLGLAFESFDALGRFRRTIGDRPIDPRGEVVQTQDADGAFTGAADLVGRLSGSEQVRACMATQWWQFALGREELPEGACWRRAAYERFAGSGFKLRELVLAIAESPALGL